MSDAQNETQETDAELSEAAKLPDSLRRLALLLDDVNDRQMLRYAADYIRKMHKRFGIKVYKRPTSVLRRLHNIEGKRLSLKEAVELYGGEGVTQNTAENRYYGRGWPLIEAIATPVYNKKGGGTGKNQRRIKKLTLK